MTNNISSNDAVREPATCSESPVRPGIAALAALVVAHGMATGAAVAQPAPASPPEPTSDDPVQLPEVLIEGQGTAPLSSPKFTAPLIDTPQTISVIPQSVFNQQGATNLTEVLRNTPGISFNAGENGFSTGSSSFAMRGFDSSDSIFIDGARDQGNYLRDTFNIQQVEVAKGAAADNGRVTAGGYVNMVTKTPVSQAFVAGTASFGFDEEGSDERYRATIDVNQPLSEHVAFRLNAVGQTGGVAGRDVAEKNLWGVAPSLAFGLGTPTRLFLSYQHVEQNDIPDYGVPSAFVKGFEPSGTTLRHDQLPAGVERTNYYGLSSDYDDVTSDSFLARVEHDFNADLTLSNQTRYSVTDRKAIFTVVSNYTAPATVATQRQGFDRENTAISNLTNLTARFDTGSLQHALATGLEISREESESGRDFAGIGLPAGTANTGTVNPDPDRAPGVALVPTNFDKVTVDSIGAYVNDTVEFSPRWQASAGLRVEHTKVKIRTSDGAIPDYDREDTSLSGKLGLVFKPVKNGTLYAAAGVATLSPGTVFLSNPDISRGGSQSLPNIAGQQGEDSRLQKLINYELGAKWAFFDDRLFTSVALFRTEKHDVGMANGTTFLGYGEQYVQGIEFSAAGAITEGWSVFGGIVFLNSKRSHSAAIDAALADGPTDGDQLAFTPKVSANLWTTYRFPFGLTLGGGLQYVGESYVGRPDNVDRSIPNGLNGKMPDYLIFNGLVAYEVTKNVTVRLNVENITDELYASNANWAARRITLGAPRSYLLSADFRF